MTDIFSFDNTYTSKDISIILRAMYFASHKHKNQRRKGEDQEPYINHPVEVANMLWHVGGVRDVNTIVAAILHDTVEDTDTTIEEIEKNFGQIVARIVEQITDDKTLPFKERKQLQIDRASTMLYEAKLIKLADKSSNVQSLIYSPPSWPKITQINYCIQSKQVIDQIRGVNIELENKFDNVCDCFMQLIENDNPE